ncbi:MAG: hypothetical protein KGI06_02465 [Candidatus Micrarchaeota archaeon]|nr:hypothetical protein [Candidatus Micrarchaeota archaeon]
MDEEGIVYLALCLAISMASLSLLFYFGTGFIRIIALIIILTGVVMILILNFADYVLISVVFSLLGITFQPAQGYTIIKEQNAVIKNVNGLFYATGYVTANLFPYTFKLELEPREEDAKMMAAPENWERAVMNLGFPFKWHVIAMGLDVQKVRDEQEGKRSYQEFQMSRALQNQNIDSVTISNIQRKINVIQRKMDRISQGEKPIATIMYVETTAIGVSMKAALDNLAQQIDGLQIALGSMDVDLSRVSGREMYTLFNFNFSLPISFDEASAHFDQQS